MKHPDVFGSLYIMSPCCLSPMAGRQGNRPPGAPGGQMPDLEKALADIKTPADSEKAPFFLRAQLASAAAWAPDPKNPPLYLDLPMKNGQPQPEVLAKLAANAPLAFIDQYIGNLRQYRAISIDVGDQDGLKTDTIKLHNILDHTGLRMDSKSTRERTPAR